MQTAVFGVLLFAPADKLLLNNMLVSDRHGRWLHQQFELLCVTLQDCYHFKKIEAEEYQNGEDHSSPLLYRPKYHQGCLNNETENPPELKFNLFIEFV